MGFAVKRGVASTRVTRRCWAGRSLLIQSRPPILPPGLTPGPDGGACRPAEWGVVGVWIRWGPFGSSGFWGGIGGSPPLSSSASWPCSSEVAQAGPALTPSLTSWSKRLGLRPGPACCLTRWSTVEEVPLGPSARSLPHGGSGEGRGMRGAVAARTWRESPSHTRGLDRSLMSEGCGSEVGGVVPPRCGRTTEAYGRRWVGRLRMRCGGVRGCG